MFREAVLIGGGKLVALEPNLTVIIPFVSWDFQLERAIRSTAAVEGLAEVILVNDGESPIRSHSLSRVREIPNTIHKGGLGARISGIKASKTQLVVFLDSDDELCSEGIKSARRILSSNPQIGVTYGDILVGQNLHRMHQACGDTYRLVLRNLSLATFSGTVFRISSASLDGLNLSLPAWTDDAFFLEVSRQTGICHVGSPVARMYSDRPVRMSSNSANRLRALRVLLGEKQSEIEQEFGKRRLLLWQVRLCILKMEQFSSGANSKLARTSAKLVRRFLQRLLKPFFDYMYA